MKNYGFAFNLLTPMVPDYFCKKTGINTHHFFKNLKFRGTPFLLLIHICQSHDHTVVSHSDMKHKIEHLSRPLVYLVLSRVTTLSNRTTNNLYEVTGKLLQQQH